MNPDSRKAGRGAKPAKLPAKTRRVVVGKAAYVPKLPAAPTPEPDLEPPAKPDLAAIRGLVLEELGRHALEAARKAGLSASSGKLRPRRAGQADTMARWLIETLFAHQAPGQEAGAEGGRDGGSGSSVTDLVEHRRQLQNALRQHRKDLNK